MRFGSICSGIEAASVAWEPLGWKPQWFCEIDPFPSAVLAHRFPYVENLGDFTKNHERKTAIDLLVGGTPCQSFSIAGLRKGMDDPRGNLTLALLGLARRLRARWIVWENVPGVLSINKGRDFGTFLGALEKLGYGWAYRVLDAQYFGVPQRRRRVFLVGYLGDRRPPAAVLFEPEELRGDSQESREAGEKLACRAGAHTGVSKREGRIIPILEVGAITGMGDERTGIGVGNQGDPMFTLQAGKQHGVAVGQYGSKSASVTASGSDGIGHGVPIVSDPYVIDPTQITHPENRPNPKPGDPAPTLPKNGHAQVLVTMHPRRLTPRECERLQGFDDDWTLVPYRRGFAKDTPRYRSIGNSMAVPVMGWIGRRIQACEDVLVSD